VGGWQLSHRVLVQHLLQRLLRLFPHGICTGKFKRHRERSRGAGRREGASIIDLPSSRPSRPCHALHPGVSSPLPVSPLQSWLGAPLARCAYASRTRSPSRTCPRHRRREHLVEVRHARQPLSAQKVATRLKAPQEPRSRALALREPPATNRRVHVCFVFLCNSAAKRHTVTSVSSTTRLFPRQPGARQSRRTSSARRSSQRGCEVADRGKPLRLIGQGQSRQRRLLSTLSTTTRVLCIQLQREVAALPLARLAAVAIQVRRSTEMVPRSTR
jgi:hypothetical protein